MPDSRSARSLDSSGFVLRHSYALRWNFKPVADSNRPPREPFHRLTLQSHDCSGASAAIAGYITWARPALQSRRSRVARGCNGRRRSDLRRANPGLAVRSQFMSLLLAGRAPDRGSGGIIYPMKRWYARRQDEAMAEQPKRVGRELRNWRTVRRAVATRRAPT